MISFLKSKQQQILENLNQSLDNIEKQNRLTAQKDQLVYEYLLTMADYFNQHDTITKKQWTASTKKLLKAIKALKEMDNK